jgi:hypothetical protein
MKRLFFLIILIVFALTACAGARMTSKSMVGDLGSPQKVDLLRQRANEFWSAFVKEDYDTVYNIFDPFFRARNSMNSFLSKTKIKYHEFEVKDIEVEGNVAKVRVRIVSSMPGIMGKLGQVISQPPAPSEFQETWLYIYDNWYKEYYMELVEKSYVYY